MNLSSSGDQIFVFQDINDTNHFIFGLNSEGATGVWQDIVIQQHFLPFQMHLTI